MCREAVSRECVRLDGRLRLCHLDASRVACSRSASPSASLTVDEVEKIWRYQFSEYLYKLQVSVSLGLVRSARKLSVYPLQTSCWYTLRQQQWPG
jgi:hypothetical protein